MNQFQTILTSIVSSTLLTGIVMFLVRHWIAERIKASITHEYDVKTERLKADLKIAADTHSIQLRQVYKEILETVTGTYSRLVDLTEKVHIYISYWGEQRGEERSNSGKEASKALIEFDDYFLKREIFLPDSIADELANFKRCLKRTANTYAIFVQNPEVGRVDPEKEMNKWEEVNKYLDEEAPNIKRSLKAEFRKILGIMEEAEQDTSHNERKRSF